MKKIKIFLGSSITEFEKERNELELFIRNLSDRFEDKYNIKIAPLRCEYMDNYVRAEGTQKAINEELVRESDMCFFIFFTKVGEFTEEEFRVAFDKFKKDGKPRIYIYFKNIPDGIDVEKSLREFMRKIDEELKHYHGSFDHIDTVKLRILLNLKIQEMDFISVEVENRECIVDGYGVLETTHINEFANSSALQSLNDELCKTQEYYYQMKPIYEKGDYSDSFYKEYLATSDKIKSLSSAVNELEKRIFEVSLHLCRDEVHGNVTVRQKEAYRLFELGDYQGCLKVLDKDEINDDFFSFEDKEIEKIKRKAVCFVREHMMAIDMMFTNLGEEKSIDYKAIEERYDIIVPVCKKYNIELDALIKYARFLCFLESNKNNCKKALSVAEDLESIYNSDIDNVSVYEWLDLKILFGDIYFKLSLNNNENTVTFCLDEALRYYKDAKKISESGEDKALTEELPYILNCIGDVYYEKKDYNSAIEYYSNAVGASKQLCEVDNHSNIQEMAFSYVNLGQCYEIMNDMDKAKENYELSLEICNNPELVKKWWIVDALYRVNYALGRFYLYSKQDEIEKAVIYFINALYVCKINVAINPLGSGSVIKLTKTICELGRFYETHVYLLKNETYYFEELENLINHYSVVFEYYPLQYRKLIADIYNSLVRIDRESKYKDLIIKYLELLIKIYDLLDKQCPGEYSEDMISVFNAAYNIYYSIGSFEKAFDYMCRIIAIEEQENNIEIDVIKRITHYNWVGSYYEKNNKLSKALEFYAKALSLSLDTAEKEDREGLYAFVAYLYGEIGKIYIDSGNSKVARFYIKEKIGWLKAIANYDPDTYIPLIAGGCFDLVHCYKGMIKKIFYLYKACYYAFQYPDNQICKTILKTIKTKNR